ncbi:hypothetical protein Tco_0871708 [Tanacetum coccineum]
MAEIKTETTMDGFVTKDRADYYSRITRITGNGKNAYELKGKFLDDLLSNVFSGTNGEDAVDYIDYFLKILEMQEWFDEFKGSITSWVDLTENLFGKYYLPYRTGWITVTKAIGDPSNSTIDQEGVAEEEFFNAEEANNDDEQETAKIFRTETNLFDYETPLCTEFKEFNSLLKVDPELFTHDIERTKTYKDYENELNDELE